ncbi:MAG: hypothetical protein JWP13_596 [Candidatus Saccharibacteria bacterium]|nr:hypothetical protein [Candidatus Saccharibacteria bacterium]
MGLLDDIKGKLSNIDLDKVKSEIADLQQKRDRGEATPDDHQRLADLQQQQADAEGQNPVGQPQASDAGQTPAADPNQVIDEVLPQLQQLVQQERDGSIDDNGRRRLNAFRQVLQPQPQDPVAVE